MSYEMIDQFLRNNLDDEDYAEYSAALDSICALPAPDVVMRDEQKPVVWMDAEGVIVGNNKDGTARPLYLHPAPDVVKQLIEALQSTEMFLDYVYNQNIDSLSFNKLMQQIIVVEQALSEAQEVGYELRTSE